MKPTERIDAARTNREKRKTLIQGVGGLLAIVLAIAVVAVPGPVAYFWYDYLSDSARIAVILCVSCGVGIALLYRKTDAAANSQSAETN